LDSALSSNNPGILIKYLSEKDQLSSRKIITVDKFIRHKSNAIELEQILTLYFSREYSVDMESIHWLFKKINIVEQIRLLDKCPIQ
jgi:hypothetical protein